MALASSLLSLSSSSRCGAGLSRSPHPALHHHPHHPPPGLRRCEVGACTARGDPTPPPHPPPPAPRDIHATANCLEDFSPYCLAFVRPIVHPERKCDNALDLSGQRLRQPDSCPRHHEDLTHGASLSQRNIAARARVVKWRGRQCCVRLFAVINTLDSSP